MKLCKKYLAWHQCNGSCRGSCGSSRGSWNQKKQNRSFRNSRQSAAQSPMVYSSPSGGQMVYLMQKDFTQEYEENDHHQKELQSQSNRNRMKSSNQYSDVSDIRTKGNRTARKRRRSNKKQHQRSNSQKSNKSQQQQQQVWSDFFLLAISLQMVSWDQAKRTFDSVFNCFLLPEEMHQVCDCEGYL